MQFINPLLRKYPLGTHLAAIYMRQQVTSHVNCIRKYPPSGNEHFRLWQTMCRYCLAKPIAVTRCDIGRRMYLPHYSGVCHHERSEYMTLKILGKWFTRYSLNYAAKNDVVDI